ncbi:MAG: hypothetical protein A2Z83_01180 [Omnitrophica bacterium GWA2_52_8]|nr:MAG: hypothetical protein A2Z83_01180 [Omnitrophica bacterium GWA2_52_8]
MRKERRKKFLINRPFQFRYMAILTGVLVSVLSVAFISLYFGIWGGVLDAFSDEQVQNDLIMASRMVEYEKARILSQEPEGALGFFKQAEKLSLRQRDIFKNILDETNRGLIPKFLLLIALIAWASIYLSHKVAGPFYRFQMSLKNIRDGNFSSRMFLRKSDEGKFIAQQFNQTAEYLDRFVGEIKALVRQNKDNPQKLSQKLQDKLADTKTSADS